MFVANIKIIKNINIVINMHMNFYTELHTVHGQIKGVYHEFTIYVTLVVM